MIDYISYYQGDVYPVESYESFSINQILDAHWGVMTDSDVSSCIFLSLELLCCLKLWQESQSLIEHKKVNFVCTKVQLQFKYPFQK